MLRTNELRQVLKMPIKIAMECHGNRVRTGGNMSSPTHCAHPKDEGADPTPQTSQ